MIAGWGNFFFAQVGASAGLGGLVLIGVSLNLTKILAYPRLPSRAFEPLALLLNVLIISSLMLVPEQPLTVVGGEILIVGLIAWATVAYLQRNSLNHTDTEYRRSALVPIVLSQVATLPYVIAGIVVLGGNAGGIYWLVPGIAVSYLNVFIDAWVLLVEINR